jgi:hypothetical protein
MAKPPRKRRLCSAQRRALELLADSTQGMNADLLLFGHGLPRTTLVSLVRAGLADVQREVIMAGDRPVEVARMRITDVGRQAIEE